MYYAGKSSGPLKFYKTQNCYKASNVELHVKDKELSAYSYDWWLFLTKIGDKVIFNNYSYSPSTSGHQSKVRRQLEALGIKIDLFITAPKGLDKLDIAITHYENLIAGFTNDLLTKRLHKKTRVAHLGQIEDWREKIKVIKDLMKVRG